MQCTYTRNIQALSRDHCCSGKAISVTYSEIVSIALVIQYAKHTHRIILPSVACPVVQHYSTYLMNGTIFENSYITENACLDFLCEIYP